jgi:hypothetical protein
VKLGKIKDMKIERVTRAPLRERRGEAYVVSVAVGSTAGLLVGRKVQHRRKICV